MATKTCTSAPLSRTIKGLPYEFRTNRHGWTVTCIASKEDRLLRRYVVATDAQGRPLRCSCPHHVERGATCKHMREAQAIRAEADAALREAARLKAPPVVSWGTVAVKASTTLVNHLRPTALPRELKAGTRVGYRKEAYADGTVVCSVYQVLCSGLFTASRIRLPNGESQDLADPVAAHRVLEAELSAAEATF